jgi:amino acid adenylation domain-containing protein
MLDVVARHAEREPAAAALEQGSSRWSYSELHERARELAAETASSTRPGEVVPLTGPATPELVCAMVAVLGAGRVLLLLDPELPQARRETMLAEAAVPAAKPADAAYVFFTSGTTGTPNAVLGRAGGLAHFLEWESRELAVAPGDRCSQLTGLSFDVVLRDMLLPLVGGATLVLPDLGSPLGPDEVPAWLEEERISVVHAVPTVTSSWLASMTAPAARSPRAVVFAGEPLSATLVEEWRRLFPGTERILNLYGPTETTLAKCCYEVPSPPRPGIQPLGRPLPDTEVLILDERLRPRGGDEAGQIAIRTPYRSAGYLNAPAETSRRFVALGDDPDDLVFLTGDRGRVDSEGLLEFLGRLDDQVKIRGVRVEPAEVAAALASHEAVLTAAVVATDEPALAAFAVPRDPANEPDPADLRAHVGSLLSPAFVPATITVVDRLPLTPNGKVDRAALAAAAAREAPIEAPAGAPQTDVERRLAAIWQEVLAVPDLGPEADFFALGGHSLTAARMLSSVRRELGPDVPLRVLFEAPTLAEFAAAVETLTPAAAG